MTTKDFFSIPVKCEFTVTLRNEAGDTIFHMGYSESEERFYIDTYDSDAEIRIKRPGGPSP